MPGTGPTIDIRGITCSVVEDGGPQESEASGLAQASVVFKCVYTERYNLVRALLGGIGLPPFPYPPSPNLYALETPNVVPARSSTIKTDILGWPTYDEAEVTCRFGILPFGFDASHPSGEAYATVSTKTTGEFLTFPDSSFKFVDGSATPVGQDVGRPMPQSAISFKRFWLDNIRQDVIASLIGKINADPWRIGRQTYLAGTLLFLGGDSEEEFDTIGGYKANVDFQFAHRPVHWNYYWHPTAAAWTLVTHNGLSGGVPPFELASFDPIRS
jgi:hypothetical protein